MYHRTFRGAPRRGRRKPARLVLLALFAVLAAAAMAACGSSQSGGSGGGGSTSGGGGGETSDSITVAIDAGVTSLDPAYACTAFYDYSIVTNLYDTIVFFGPETEASGRREIVPHLAESWKVDGSETEYTFKIKKDVKFPSGNPLTAEDFVYGYERILEKEGCQQYVMTLGEPDLIESIKALDKYTVQFQLSRKNPLFLDQLAQPGVAPIDRKLLEEHGGLSKEGDAWLAQHSAGAGAYELTEYQPDSRVVLQAVPNYWQGEAKTKEAVFRVVTDPTTLQTLTQSGEADLTYGTPLKDIQSMEASGREVIANKTPFYIMLGLNNTLKPLDDIKVRQAIQAALPLEEMTEQLGYGYAETFTGPIPPAMPYYADLPLPEHSVEKAKELLAEAGDVPSLKIDVIAGKSTQAQVGTIVQGSLAEIGIDAQISMLGSAAFFDRVGNFKSDAYLILDGPPLNDPGYFLNFLIRCDDPFNWVQYCNKEVDELLHEGLTSTDPEVRATAYKKVSEIVSEEAPLIPIFAPEQVIIADPGVQGYEAYPAGELLLWPISVEA